MMIWGSEGYFDLKDLSHWDDVSFLSCKRGVVKMASCGNHHKNEIFVLFWWSARLLRETVPLLRYAKYWAQVRNLDCMLAHEQRRVTPLGSDLIWVGKIHQQISWPKKGRVKGKSRRNGCCLSILFGLILDVFVFLRVGWQIQRARACIMMFVLDHWTAGYFSLSGKADLEVSVEIL